ncbi:uncharacterized protein A4U43_C04F29360 [Asparagus officinalis]|uniref:Protein kinase domain-containing protein n=1 Tax=Asparagus officinalis TaxID=4686 RepID=A0A5P1F798_ASPOF|nr:probable receptor-like protein kinase At5g18500 [Asparagus officinalis]ONK73287.1 uncharacterized protein A4U43_C04F29360 [Asparagus officinalis]
MKMPNEQEEREGKAIVVGVRMDQQSKELLTWALVKIAHPGDQVIALHILPSSSSSIPASDPDGNSLSSSIDRDLESMLAVYEGFCNLKQIDLKLKVCKGSSLRRVLVREANAFVASQLILGVAKHSHAIGPSPISVAKYCAKKLPRSCSVLAVSNGKIVFQREARENKESGSSAPKSSSPHHPKIDCKTDFETTSERNCSICDSSKEKVEKCQAPSCSLKPIESKELPLVKTGWPILRKSVLTRDKTKTPKGTVIQWAMQLPARYSTSSVAHPTLKLKKSNSIDKLNLSEERLKLKKSNSIDKLNLSGEKDCSLPKELEKIQEKYSSVCRLFSYKELVDATSNFSPEKLIGKGGSSRVYNGCLSDGKQLAVKILKPSEDARKEFISEIEILTTLRHKNIVSIVGFCFGNNHLILVYDLLPRGSLEENLHGDKEDMRVINWTERYKIAVGVAEALDYLHSDSSTQPVIHKDVKSSNILLSDDFEPQLSDFGLATWASASQSLTMCSDVAGTFGYLAPEYFMYGRVDEKIDVYAFGIVLLELLSGRKPISTEGPQVQKSLVLWAKPILHNGKSKELVDPFLSNEYDSDQLERMILAASLCIKRAARSRPKMSLVLKLLKGDEETVKWAKSRVSSPEEIETLDDDDEVAQPDSNLRSHLNLALLDVEDDSTSVSSTEQTLDFVSSNTSLDDYLQGRWSRSSSFD